MLISVGKFVSYCFVKNPQYSVNLTRRTNCNKNIEIIQKIDDTISAVGVRTYISLTHNGLKISAKMSPQ